MSAGRAGNDRGRIVGLLGAESTGKTSLAADLCAHWRALGVDAVLVDEYLREFCAHHQRTPRAEEQRNIMREQTRRIAQAASQHALVLADTTALMTAAYSQHVFGDGSLTADAMAAHSECAATLVLRPDLPWQEDGLYRDGPQARAPIDAWLLSMLESQGLPRASVRGLGRSRFDNALAALRTLGFDPSSARSADQRSD